MYIELATGRYPVSENDIRAEHPNISFPRVFQGHQGFAWVFPTPKPEFDTITQVCTESAPSHQNGMYFQSCQYQTSTDPKKKPTRRQLQRQRKRLAHCEPANCTQPASAATAQWLSWRKTTRSLRSKAGRSKRPRHLPSPTSPTHPRHYWPRLQLNVALRWMSWPPRCCPRQPFLPVQQGRSSASARR